MPLTTMPDFANEKNLLKYQSSRILAITTITAVLMTALFGFERLTSSEIDLQFHDTYFATSPFLFGFLIFLILTYIYYLLVQIREEFSHNTTNGILILVNCLLLISFIIFFLGISSAQLAGGNLAKLLNYTMILLPSSLIYTVLRSIKAYKSK